MKHLDKKLYRLHELKKTIAEMDKERKELEAQIIEHLESVEVVTLDWGDDRIHKASVVYSSTMKIDEAGLQDALTDRQWSSITKRVIDEKLLEDKVARGQIDVDIVAQHTEEVPRKPYVRLTMGK